LRRKDKGGALSNHQAWGHLDGDIHANWRVDIDDNPGMDTNARLNFAMLQQTATSSERFKRFNLCDNCENFRAMFHLFFIGIFAGPLFWGGYLVGSMRGSGQLQQVYSSST